MPSRIVLIAYVADDPSGWLPALVSLNDASDSGRVQVAASALIAAPMHVDRIVPSLSDLLRDVCDDPSVDWVVVAGEPCIVPRDLVGRLEGFSDDRYASVSFLCNSAGPLSFPHLGQPQPWAPEDRSPDSLTAALRTIAPIPTAVPVPVAAGAVVAFSATAVRMLPPGWDRSTSSFAESAAAFSLSSHARGLINVLDEATYVHRAADLRPLQWLSVESSHRLLQRFPWMEPALRFLSEDSPVSLEHVVARSKISGLKVLLDGSCLGPTEMGTQVGLLSIAMALSERSDVANVTITFPHVLPAYARHLLEQPKIDFVRTSAAKSNLGHDFDVAFRPFQPDEDFDVASLRDHARRVMVSLLDLIAYQNGSYFRSGEAWQRYRRSITDAMRAVDGVTTISQDVVTMVQMERLPIAPDRVFSVAYGTEHLQLTAARRMPAAFESMPDARFLVTLGTNYGHKNRDLSVRTLQCLVRRGLDLKLVLVGPSVPYGSSREHEAIAMVEATGDDVVVLPSVPAEERNWLLQHAVAVLYPTSAEGFGLVPYEAAWLGTPTIFVPFGPLAEISGASLPLEASDWSPESFADEVEKLVADPRLGALQIERLRAASTQTTWAHTAAALCETFRSVLSMPPQIWKEEG